MRRRLTKVAPVLSARFGLHPFDLERLTPREVRAYLGLLADLAAEADK